jgi:hypothetical protein
MKTNRELTRINANVAVLVSTLRGRRRLGASIERNFIRLSTSVPSCLSAILNTCQQTPWLHYRT